VDARRRDTVERKRGGETAGLTGGVRLRSGHLRAWGRGTGTMPHTPGVVVAQTHTAQPTTRIGRNCFPGRGEFAFGRLEPRKRPSPKTRPVCELVRIVADTAPRSRITSRARAARRSWRRSWRPALRL